MHSKLERSVGIDFARSSAVIGVVLVHTTSWAPGAYGIPLFFMISGYLLADIKIIAGAKKFLIMRWFRLWPLAVLMSVSYFFRFNSIIEIASTIALLHIFFLNQPSFPGSWSISSEWIYSIINVFLVRRSLPSRIYLFGVTGAILLTVEFFRFESQGFEQRNIYGLLLLFGNLAYFIAGNILREIRILKIPFGFFLFVLIPLTVYSINNLIHPILYPFLVIFFFMASLSITNFTQKIDQACHFLGKRTYGIFCGHFVAIGVFSHIEPIWKLYQSGLVQRSSFFLIVFIPTIALSQLTYKYIEKPSLKLAMSKF